MEKLLFERRTQMMFSLFTALLFLINFGIITALIAKPATIRNPNLPEEFREPPQLDSRSTVYTENDDEDWMKFTFKDWESSNYQFLKKPVNNNKNNNYNNNDNDIFGIYSGDDFSESFDHGSL